MAFSRDGAFPRVETWHFHEKKRGISTSRNVAFTREETWHLHVTWSWSREKPTRYVRTYMIHQVRNLQSFVTRVSLRNLPSLLSTFLLTTWSSRAPMHLKWLTFTRRVSPCNNDIIYYDMNKQYVLATVYETTKPLQ